MRNINNYILPKINSHPTVFNGFSNAFRAGKKRCVDHTYKFLLCQSRYDKYRKIWILRYFIFYKQNIR